MSNTIFVAFHPSPFLWK